MRCPKCGAEMVYYEGEDEFGGNELLPYSQWDCPTANDHTIHDFDDEFEYPPESEQPAHDLLGSALREHGLPIIDVHQSDADKAERRVNIDLWFGAGGKA